MVFDNQIEQWASLNFSFINLLKKKRNLHEIHNSDCPFSHCVRRLESCTLEKKSLTVVDAFVRGDFCYFSKQKDCIKMSKRNYF